MAGETRETPAWLIAHINGLDIYHSTTGVGERVVLVHGSWTNADTWQAITPMLADRYEVVVWDRRGHSRSQDAEGPGSLKEDATDLAALIEYLGDGPVHVVGNSSGGAIALNLATTRHHLVKSACAHEPGAFALPEGVRDELLGEEKVGEARVRELIEGGRAPGGSPLLRRRTGHRSRCMAGLPPELRDVLVANAHTVPIDMEEAYRVGSIDVDGLVGTPTPVLLSLGAASSEILRSSTRLLADRIHSELHELPGTGHIPHRTHPQEYAALRLDFLARSRSVL